VAADEARDDPAGDFEVTGETEVYAGYLVSVAQVQVLDPDGRPFERDIVHHPGAVAFLPVHDDGTVTLVRQFRTAFATTVLEAPAGTRDVDGESAEATARRELVEEAGLEADGMELLVEAYNSPGYCDQVTSVFLATGLRPVPTDRGAVEERWMTTERVALDDVSELVANGTLHDSLTILGIGLARAALARRGGAR